MITGAATQGGTMNYASAFNSLHYNLLGRTNWQVSQAGFGSYRVNIGIDAHYQALHKSLSNGINLIDTSTNYSDGGSEQLVGQVLADMVSKGDLRREAVVVVSKIGYLQGRNFALSEARRQQGNPFPDVVPYGNGLEHCIHPEFIEDQLSRSLQRLGLETLDLLLLHNPEYYLMWAAKQGHSIDQTRQVFYQRIRMAFEYLEEEVAGGRIQAYGVSANTFPGGAQDSDFVRLESVWQIAREVSENHHFRVVQFPMNLYENGAALEKNQSDYGTVLGFAQHRQLGVLINRPLNAFSGNRLVRLAEVEKIGHHSDTDIIQAISLLNKSEKKLWRKLLPAMNLPAPLYQRIKDQSCVGDQLKHHWRHFGNYERWRQFKDGLLWPHMIGVFEFLQPHAESDEDLALWLSAHHKKLFAAVRAVGSLYAGEAAREVSDIKQRVANADGQWDVAGSLSQMALRTLRSTAGIHTVLVGMRMSVYVDDVLTELVRPVTIENRASSWQGLRAALLERV